MAYNLDSRIAEPLLEIEKPSIQAATSTNWCTYQQKEDCLVDIPKEKTVEYISCKVHEVLRETNRSAYEPTLISIGPFHIEQTPSTEREIKESQDSSHKGSKEHRLENNIKEAFHAVFFGGPEAEGLKVRCEEKLRDMKDKALSWYANDDKRMVDDEFLKMLLLDGCFILEFFFQMQSPEGADKVAFMKVDAKVAQTLSDLLLFENQIPFFVLFELYKLKRNCYNDGADVLEALLMIVKKCFVARVPKLTPKSLDENKYEPARLPEHLLEVVHSICIPRNMNTKNGEEFRGTSEQINTVTEFEKDGASFNKNAKSDKKILDILEQINTATELENDGVSFEKIGYVYGGCNFDKNDNTTLFDIDFKNGILKIPCFKIDDYTETFLRNMIAYEQHSTVGAKYFSDFARFMDQLINSTKDVNLLRRRGIIVNLLATDDAVTEIFNNMGKGVIISTTFSQVINNINRHGDQAWNIWWGRLRQGYHYSPWILINTIVGTIIFLLGGAVALKNLIK